MVIEKCPFCKNELLDIGAKKVGARSFHFVSCPKCGCDGPNGLDEKGAIEWWNSATARTTPSAGVTSARVNY